MNILSCYGIGPPFTIFICFAAARIGDGILLDHGTGVVIGETAVVGNRVSMMHVSQPSFSFAIV